ncbi:dCTP deaminase [Pimelobacter simplex]|uniref:dCTP deaminase n=1 Tax=Nocardioides simplex TaxID=2045 RepID=UPI00068E9935|nr:dCTP deaminase [Pimelobacter simplex]MCG8150640.1 dCTP deaminase [Pimelobacter simplex]GEB15162.1 hypothetical protein NSI01_34770 [Pimelobacter simplex]SFM85638.1 deoxycytidine triphosphate deaminase [Pimelobacter simplex]
MYLTDQQITARLAELQLEADDLADPFDPQQIGPCSIDLRLSRIYWLPRARSHWRFGRPPAIDLNLGQLMELNPSRGWRRVEAKPQDSITIKPGQLVLARTSERFHVPSDCAAALEGRSSFARLGLSIHAAGGFINPGYTGRMPLTLFNQSPFTLRIPVGTPLCQLMFIKLKEAPKADYAQLNDRKYRDDYGGPSYWWRDEAMRRLRDRAAGAKLGPRVFDELDELFAKDEPDIGVYERLETHISKRGSLTYGTADELLSSFSEREQRRELVAKIGIYSARAALPLALGAAIPYWAFTEHVSKVVALLAALACVLAGLVTLWGVYQPVPNYLTKDRLRKLQAAGTSRPTPSQPTAP